MELYLVIWVGNLGLDEGIEESQLSVKFELILQLSANIADFRSQLLVRGRLISK